LGYILDKRKEAEELIDFHQGWMNTIKDRVEKLSEMEKPRVYLEALPYGYKAKGKGTGYHHRIELAGGNNIFGDLEGSVDVDPEEVIVRDPEIIIGDATHIDIGGYDVDAKDITELKKVRDEIMNRPELQKVTALKDGKVYIITHATVCGELISISYHAKWFHPELFKVLDPKAIHQEYLTKFLGLDIDLDEKGVFVYPEPS
jgi:iron complex transport system substrate-binding protein